MPIWFLIWTRERVMGKGRIGGEIIPKKEDQNEVIIGSGTRMRKDKCLCPYWVGICTSKILLLHFKSSAHWHCYNVTVEISKSYFLHPAFSRFIIHQNNGPPTSCVMSPAGVLWRGLFSLNVYIVAFFVFNILQNSERTGSTTNKGYQNETTDA